MFIGLALWVAVALWAAEALRGFGWLEYVSSRAAWVVGLTAVGIVIAFLFNVGSYGLEQGLLGLDSPISITPAPRDTVDFITLPWPKPNVEVKGNRHSSVYISREVIKHIDDWLRSNFPEWIKDGAPRS